MASDRRPRIDEEAVREGAAGGGADHRLPADDRVERHREQHARHHGRERCRRLGVGVRQPRVHRRQPGLRPVAHQDEHERQLEDLGVEGGGRGHQHGPVQGRFLGAHQTHEVEIPEHGATEGERDAHRPDQHVLPGGLDGRLGDVEGDQHRRRDRRRFDRHPHQPDVVRRDREQHREDEEVGEDPEAPGPARLVAAPEPGTEPCGQRRHRRDAGGQQRRQGVDAQEILPTRRRRRRPPGRDHPARGPPRARPGTGSRSPIRPPAGTARRPGRATPRAAAAPAGVRGCPCRLST